MKHPDPKLLTPIYVKDSPDMPWPAHEDVFYLLSGNDLFLCRNHAFFTSSVPAPCWPSELAGHEKFLRVRYPKIPRRIFEQIIGFFDIIARRHSAEAAVLLAWDPKDRCIRVIVPEQTATVGTDWSGRNYPMDVRYEIPPLPDGCQWIGDAHSHVDDSAYASYTDKKDETHSAGLHIVVGRIREEPPELHIEAVVDGARFRVSDLAMVVEGYHQRTHKVPLDWIRQVRVVPWKSKEGGAAASQASVSSAAPREVNRSDRETNPA